LLSCQDRSIWRKIWPESFTWPNTAPWCLTWQSMNHRWKIGSEWLDTAYHGIPLLHYPSLHYPTFTSGSGCGASKTCYISAMNRSERALMFSFCTSEMPCGAGSLSLCSPWYLPSKMLPKASWNCSERIGGLSHHSNRRKQRSHSSCCHLLKPNAKDIRWHQKIDQTDETCCLMLTYVVFGAACDSCLWLWISPVLPPPSAWR